MSENLNKLISLLQSRASTNLDWKDSALSPEFQKRYADASTIDLFRSFSGPKIAFDSREEPDSKTDPDLRH